MMVPIGYNRERRGDHSIKNEQIFVSPRRYQIQPNDKIGAGPQTLERGDGGFGAAAQARTLGGEHNALQREIGALTEPASTGTCAIAESAAAPREKTPKT
jgi:hypothetical protein